MRHALSKAGFRPLTCGPFRVLLRPRLVKIAAMLALVVGLLVIYGVTRGSLPIPTSAIGRALFYPDVLSAQQVYIVRDIRLPRLLMAVFCGGMLGLAGAAMQSITRNGLADPGLIGVKEGTSVVVLTLILAFPSLSLTWRPLAGMLVGVSWALSAAMGLFVTTADIRDVQTAMTWLAGSLHAATWPLLAVAVAWALPAGVILYLSARAADVAMLGNQVASSLGVRLARLTLLRFLAPVLLTAASVSCVGSLGFVGLMAPHMARFLLSGGQVSLLTGSALIGALLVLLTDTIGRLAFAPLQIPAGIIISLIGCPFFILLLWRRRDAL